MRTKHLARSVTAATIATLLFTTPGALADRELLSTAKFIWPLIWGGNHAVCFPDYKSSERKLKRELSDAGFNVVEPGRPVPMPEGTLTAMVFVTTIELASGACVYAVRLDVSTSLYVLLPGRKFKHRVHADAYSEGGLYVDPGKSSEEHQRKVEGYISDLLKDFVIEWFKARRE